MAEKASTYELLKALFYSGKVKPSLNKILAELNQDPDNLELNLLACRCLLRAKEYDKISKHADAAIAVDGNKAAAYHFKGLALHHTKGKEQEALKNFNQALEFEPENVVFLKDKAITHLALYEDYDLPVKFAEKHRDKSQECFVKLLQIIHEKEKPTYHELYTMGESSLIIGRNIDAKQYFLKAEKVFEKAEDSDKNQNIYKDIVKGKKESQKLIDKFTE